MKITLISDDRNLQSQCRDVLVDAKQPSWTLIVVSTFGVVPEADLYIWDFDSTRWDFDSRGSLRAYPDLSPAKNLFLVDRNDLRNFRRSRQQAIANILMKPFSRGLLGAFLDAAFAARCGTAAASGKDLAGAECLVETSLRLQQHEQNRSNFIARIAHDLRTPVTALLGYCGLLLDDHQGLNEKQRTILRHMQNSANRLPRMASEMFELSVEHQPSHSGGIDLQRGDLHGCIDQALHEVAPFAVDKRITVETKLGLFDGDMYFNRASIERVLINILENACRFTPKNGRIEISGYPMFWERRNANAVMPAPAERRSSICNAPNGYRLDILNSGAAIPPNLLDYIFEQYTAAQTHQRAHCGLGLAICRTIVLGHGGRICAENTETGPRFSFVLPFESPASFGAHFDSQTTIPTYPVAFHAVI